MAEDPSRFIHSKLVVHEVPRQFGAKPDPPILSQFELPLEPEVATFFRDRTTRSLLEEGVEVKFRHGAATTVPKLISDIFDKPSTFLLATQEITSQLARSQGAGNNAGLLSIALGKIEQKPALAIMKLEKANGVRVETVHHNDGRVALSPKAIHDLMLTQQTRVFKVGMFIKISDDPQEIVGTVSDEQQRGRTQIADFFLADFLGCELVQQSSVSTRRFFETLVGFVNSRVPEVTTRASYMRAAVAALNSNATTLNVKGFVRDHVNTKHQSELSKLLAEQNVPNSFRKDVQEIKSKLSRMVIDFKNGASVIAPYEIDPATFKLDQGDDGRTKVTVHDKVKGVGGRK